MKTQLIPLEAHDDLISVRDRMSWAKTPRILLVWPKSIRIPLRALDLKVLQRHAFSLGAQLGLVTRHPSIRREAQAQGIPVFSTTGEAQRNPWPKYDIPGKRKLHEPRRDLRQIREKVRTGESSWSNYPIVRILFFSLGVLAVLAIVFLFIPKAQVILSPETVLQTVSLPVQADPSVKVVYITGNVPARELHATVRGVREILTTGSVPVPQSTSEGVVTFRNLTEADVSIPFGTVLTSTGLPGVRFLTMEQGDLPGGLEETIDVRVQAESSGDVGNVEAGSILAIEGDLGLRVAVTNEEPTSGGYDRVTMAATEGDLVRLREELLRQLELDALQEMESMLQNGDQLIPDTIIYKQILDETYSPSLGQPARKVNLTLQVEFVASYVSGDDLTELASTVLNASQLDGYVDAGEPLKFETLNSYETNKNGITNWDMRVSRRLKKRVDVDKVISLVKGHSTNVAIENMEDALNLDYTPEIIISPKWWPWFPLIPFNITVETQ